MRIGVVTPYDSNNYGAFLQAFALKSFLEEQGHEVFHIRTRTQRETKKLFYHIRPWKNDVRHPVQYVKSTVTGIKKYYVFKKEHAFFSIIKPSEAKKMDCIILGSDEIWNINIANFCKPIFFGRGFERCIAYAPSAGRASIEQYKNNPELINDLKNIKTILVRDEKTGNLVQQLTGKKPDLVLDPTFLWNWKDIREQHQYKGTNLNDIDYILIYAYKLTNDKVEAIKRYAEKSNLKTVAACFKCSWCDINIICSPLEFLSVVEKAKCVVTTTFHGTIFSILNEKKFVSMPISPKTIQLLEMLSLSDRMLQKRTISEKDIEEIINNPINFGQVNTIIEQHRSRSSELLMEAISWRK